MADISKAPISEAAWNPSTTDYKDAAAFCDACLIDCNEGGEKDASKCKLPVFTAKGELSRRGVAAATARINQVQGASPEEITTAKSKLRAAHARLGMQTPDAIKGDGHKTMNSVMRGMGGQKAGA